MNIQYLQLSLTPKMEASLFCSHNHNNTIDDSFKIFVILLGSNNSGGYLFLLGQLNEFQLNFWRNRNRWISVKSRNVPSSTPVPGNVILGYSDPVEQLKQAIKTRNSLPRWPRQKKGETLDMTFTCFLLPVFAADIINHTLFCMSKKQPQNSLCQYFPNSRE